jgi:hypothetical protein
MNSDTTPDVTPGHKESSEPNLNVKGQRVLPLLRKLGLDIIPVIIGILIALFINNAQQNYRDKKLLDSTLQSLSNEFSYNAMAIKGKLPLHQQWIDTLLQYKDSEHYSIQDLMTKVGSVSTANIFTTNWQATLGNNSLGFLNFETVQLLSKIDAQHQELRRQEDLLYPIVFGPPLSKTGKEGWEYRQGLELWFIAFRANEESLLELYEEFKQVVARKQYVQDSR